VRCSLWPRLEPLCTSVAQAVRHSMPCHYWVIYQLASYQCMHLQTQRPLSRTSARICRPGLQATCSEGLSWSLVKDAERVRSSACPSQVASLRGHGCWQVYSLYEHKRTALVCNSKDRGGPHVTRDCSTMHHCGVAEISILIARGDTSYLYTRPLGWLRCEACFYVPDFVLVY